jgi:hypothetical protein
MLIDEGTAGKGQKYGSGWLWILTVRVEPAGLLVLISLLCRISSTLQLCYVVL